MRKLPIILLMAFVGCATGSSLQEQRQRMVAELQHPRYGTPITDKRVLEAMLRVPRHEFVPPRLRRFAYENGALSIGSGQTISQPYIVALMTQSLRLEKDDKVLEIGTGSGYQAAVLAEITPHVYSIEVLPELARGARSTLDRLGYQRVKTKTGDGYQGWKEHAPFDAIVVTCAPDHVPEPLVQQLKEGGRMVIPVGKEGSRQTLYLLEKKKGKLLKTGIEDVRFVPMIHPA
jgi:protein-L-isoaspartate(D-aspartate) O-methyltransferase